MTEDIEEVKVVNNMKYLGIVLDNKKNMYKSQKYNMIQKAKKLANMTYNITKTCCNKILIGKAYWKSIALPSILYGSSIINITNTEINKLQRIENQVYRQN